MAARRRFQFRNEDVKPADALERVLNDFALDVQSRLESLEKFNTALAVFELTTGAAPTDGMPVRITTAGTPRGLKVVRVENLSGSGLLTVAPWLEWRAATGGVEIVSAVGLAASTKYRLTVEVLYV
jgi:hypothetical protein